MTAAPHLEPGTCPICQQPSDRLSPDGYCLHHEAEIRGDSSDRATAGHTRSRLVYTSTDQADPDPTTADSAGHPRRPSRRWRGLRSNGTPLRVSCWDRHGAVGLCPTCLHDLSLILSDIPWLLDDLDTAIAGNVSFVERGQRHDQTTHPDTSTGSGENPAVTAHHRLTIALQLAGDWFDTRSPEQLAVELHRMLDQLADEPLLRRVADQVSAAAARAHRVIDRPADLFAYGPCPTCGTEIVQERVIHGGHITCPRGDYTEDLDTHIANQLTLRDDSWFPEDQLVGVLTINGQELTRQQLRTLVDRHGLPREKRPWVKWGSSLGRLDVRTVWLYRVGDIRDLMAARNQT